MKSIQALTASLLRARPARTAILARTLLAIVGIALISLPAKAALTYQDGDVFLGFRVTGAGSPSYLVDLGSYTQFTLNSTLSFGGSSSIGADLISLYGAQWYDRTDLAWGIFGANDANGITLFASKARTNLATQVTPWAAINYNSRGNTETAINNVRNNFINAGITTALTGNAGSQAASNTLGYYYYAVNPSQDFGSNSGWTGNGIEGSSASGIDATVLDLVQVGQSEASISSQVLGKFTIADDGSVGYVNAAAVPEPSTYAFLGAGLAILSFWQRRRKLSIQKA